MNATNTNATKRTRSFRVDPDVDLILSNLKARYISGSRVINDAIRAHAGEAPVAPVEPAALVVQEPVPEPAPVPEPMPEPDPTPEPEPVEVTQ